MSAIVISLIETILQSSFSILAKSLPYRNETHTKYQTHHIPIASLPDVTMTCLVRSPSQGQAGERPWLQRRGKVKINGWKFILGEKKLIIK